MAWSRPAESTFCRMPLDGLRDGVRFMKPMSAWFVSDAAAMAAISLQPIYIMLAARGLGADSYAAGCIASASMLIKLVSGVMGGLVADTSERQTVMMMSGICQTVVWSTYAALVFLGFANVILFSIFTLISSLVWGLLGGAADAALRGIAHDEMKYVRAKTACEGRNSVIGLVCSPVGALFYCVSPAVVPIAQAALFLLSAVFACKLHQKKGQRLPSNSGVSTRVVKNNLRLLHEGFSWVIHQHRILALLMAASLVNFSFQIWQYGLQYVQLDGGQSALGVSVLDMASCAGVLIGAIVAMRTKSGVSPLRSLCMVIVALASASACLILKVAGNVSAATSLAVLSLPMPCTSASIQGEVFVKVPDEMQGRARAVLNVIAQGFCLMAPMAASYLSSRGAEPTICLASAIPVVFALVCVRISA